MMTPTKDCAGKTGNTAGSKEQKCLPCDIPAFERNAYYTGKLLTARDLNAEQRYFRDKLRLHYAALHGWGVVCGLKVKPHPYCPKLKIVVEEGFAIDSCGREIRVLEEFAVSLPPEVKKPAHSGGEEHPEHQREGRGREERYEDRDRDWDRGEERGRERTEYREQERGEREERECREREEHEHHEHEHHEHHEHGVKLYICLRYVECETEFMPAPFDECGCNASGDRAGRVSERFRIEISDQEPDWLKHQREEECEENCEELYEHGPGECRKPDPSKCILLAVIHRYEAGLAVTEEQIDNHARRPVLRSTQELDQLVGCLIRKFPSRRLTHICSINWMHGEEYHCHDFMRRYIARPGEHAGFEIEFDGQVFPEGISSRSFQAMVVWRPPDPSDVRRMEIAPARIEHRPNRCVLEIDPEYAKRHLHDREFDLFITLKCDVVLDEHGHAVDGNLLARLHEDDEGHKRYQVMTPTGDGVPGGLFESWIRVRTRTAAS
jgi:hypothetical protein